MTKLAKYRGRKVEALKQRILNEGISLGSDRINVDGFINHKIDTAFMEEIGKEFGRRFADVKVDKILTVEASGIAIAMAAARYFDYVPVVFAKKAAPNTMIEDCYTADAISFTKQVKNVIRVARKHIEAGENILILDDFLAHGEASKALCKIIEAAGAHVAGIGIVISKDFQGGKKSLEDMGYRVETLASVAHLEDGKIEFV